MRLRLTILVSSVFVLVSTVALPAQTVQGSASDIAEIHRIIDAHATGWNRGDAKTVAHLWHEDGDIRNSDEGVIKSRAAIQARYEKMFAGWAKGTVHSHPGAVTIRFLSPDVVVADGFYQVDGIKGTDGKQQPAEKGSWTIVCTKVNGVWGIASLR